MNQHYNWTNLVGFEKQENYFYKLTTKQALPPVHLIVGREGCGKSLFINKMAAYFFCEKGTGCGVCKACKELIENRHKQVLIIDTEGQAIKVSNIPQIHSHLSLQAKTNKKSTDKKCARIVFIIDSDLLTQASMNKLLKVLEEPPDNTFIFLTTSRIKNLAQTIRSRCVTWYIKPPSSEAVMSLVENSTPRPLNARSFEEFQSLIKKKNLSPGKALKTIDDWVKKEPHQNKITAETENNLLTEITKKPANDILQHLKHLKENHGNSLFPIIKSIELSLNDDYKKKIKLNKKRSENVSIIKNRRKLISSIKFFSRQNISLNTQLNIENILL
ncbi:MAG: hypothetical protein CMP11_08140 [Zetaproteobacteria bacterium]|nr:hypothetical protein [Pseudobdellovibrionaceae bacterium]|tara:strand:+ start:2304 stop:3293 length:990 start_codon:yes stop_codon:yes gene_type:complete